MDEKKLTHEGEDELMELAERFQKRFPELLPETYSNSSFKVLGHNPLISSNHRPVH